MIPSHGAPGGTLEIVDSCKSAALKPNCRIL
jgi:hypothetical protein